LEYAWLEYAWLVTCVHCVFIDITTLVIQLCCYI